MKFFIPSRLQKKYQYTVISYVDDHIFFLSDFTGVLGRHIKILNWLPSDCDTGECEKSPDGTCSHFEVLSNFKPLPLRLMWQSLCKQFNR